MNENVLENIYEEYKPYYIDKKNNVYIMRTTRGNYVVKINPKINYYQLWSYLKSRNFNYIPELVYYDDNKVVLMKYIFDLKINNNQKALDLAEIVALLHLKTVFFREVKDDKYKEIYNKIKDNILYIQNYYSNLYDLYINEYYIIPSHYYLLRNYYMISNAISYALDKLDYWYNSLEDKTKQRVCLLHNNLSLEHFIHNENNYLISWDKYSFDTPVLDIFKFYKNEWNNISFIDFFNKYKEKFKLLEDEENLFYILISIPYEVKESSNELDNCRELTKLIDYLKKSEKIVFAKEKN